MAIIAADSGSNFKLVPPGNHIARCYRMIDLGTQPVEREGVTKLQHKIRIGWELHGVDDDGNPLVQDDGRPMTVTKQYTLSLGKVATLRADLESWRGRPFTDEELRGFDIGKLLNVYCMLQVIHNASNGKTYANIASISKVPAALKNTLPAPVLPAELFDINEPDMALFDTFHDKLKETIRGSTEWRERNGAAMQPATAGGGYSDMDDDIQF